MQRKRSSRLDRTRWGPRSHIRIYFMNFVRVWFGQGGRELLVATVENNSVGASGGIRT